MSFPIENTLFIAAVNAMAVFMFMKTRFNAVCVKYGSLLYFGGLESRNSFNSFAALCFLSFDR